MRAGLIIAALGLMGAPGGHGPIAIAAPPADEAPKPGKPRDLPPEDRAALERARERRRRRGEALARSQERP
jgi:hypothetical protein